jgi:hypothetical protein
MKIQTMKKTIKQLPKNKKYLVHLNKLNSGKIKIPENLFKLNQETFQGKYKIKIYFPRQFEAFRLQNKIYLKDYIMSISTTNIWENTGGVAAKSFQKSYDGQYVIKGVSKGEFNNFKNFVKEYLIYFLNCELDNRPTLLTLILGF